MSDGEATLRSFSDFVRWGKFPEGKRPLDEVLHLSIGVSHWDVWFSRLVQDWDLGAGALVAFMELIYSKHFRGEGVDRPCWRPTKSRGFKVQSYYQPLSASNSMSFHSKLEWQSKFLPKVVFFFWAVALGWFYLLTISKREVLLYWIGSAYVKGVGS